MLHPQIPNKGTCGESCAMLETIPSAPPPGVDGHLIGTKFISINLICKYSTSGTLLIWTSEIRTPIHSISVNSHLVQNRLKIDVTPIIAYVGYTHLLARATVAQWF